MAVPQNHSLCCILVLSGFGVLAACGGTQDGTSARSGYAPNDSSSGGPGGVFVGSSIDSEESTIESDVDYAASPAPIAQAAPAAGATAETRSRGNASSAASSTTQPAASTATDAVNANTPLLIYTAELHLAVYEVAETQERVLTAIGEMDGFLAQRRDELLVVRVPVARFDEALSVVEEAGDVVSRNVQATDVSEEFRDLSIRIRNAEAMRERLEQLLNRAANVQEALSIERELQRLTETIETMKGRQRFLSDRIAFSTITIRFRSRVTDQGPSDEFELPFDWLNQLGLARLLDL